LRAWNGRSLFTVKVASTLFSIRQVVSEQTAMVGFAQDGTGSTGRHRNAQRTAEPGSLAVSSRLLPLAPRIGGGLVLMIGGELRLALLGPRPQAPAVVRATLDLVEVAAAADILAADRRGAQQGQLAFDVEV
jgi:hypothetical protein